MLRIQEGENWENVQLNNNSFIARDDAIAPLMLYSGDVANSAVGYSGNEYFTSFDESQWFNYLFTGRFDFAQWVNLTGETNASVADFTPSDPDRNVDSYAVSLGVGSTIGDFAEEARKQSRFNYREEYEAKAVNAYIREGYQP